MRKILLMIAVMAIALGATAKEKKDTTVCFTISPAMSCQNCENKIKSNLRFEKGVTAIEANAPGDKVNITYNKEKTDASKIEKAFGKIGYKATTGAVKVCNKKAAGKACSKEGCQKTEGKACCKDGCKKQEVKACDKKEGKTCCKNNKSSK